ncbi:ABC transporter ATP-binding protein [Acidisoma cellulosilytica]|uniref:ABC transporter ATP-binding protein n=1 Tax=Acidisoma cellulosilyticum TaxID=2802395 RepID=A0A963Z738_9PROT|nr:ABC transporter ATP-binding protein [Acidisoma cellulosilyticum]MCB8883798.1 ABC transporter ATP-binding protein [Acidisoma cellulosilyticum]
MTMPADALVSIRDLTVQFRTDRGWVSAIEDISLDINAGECLGVVGESGSGKSVTALSILRLHARGTARAARGSIMLDGRDLLRAPERDLRRVRGGDIAMVFQDPMSSLNPVLTIADQISESLRLHQGLSRAEGRSRAIELLDLVRIADAPRRADEYPHRLSGGMRQRVMIAIAIACRPRLLIADEPTTALDVTIQAQILELLRDLRAELGMAVMMISHDLGVIAEFAHRVVVMYAGRIVEQAPVGTLFSAPRHPYTEGLMTSLRGRDIPGQRLGSIPGRVPDPDESIPGCRFGPRCAHVEAVCRAAVPALVSISENHDVRCTPRSQALAPACL